MKRETQGQLDDWEQANRAHHVLTILKNESKAISINGSLDLGVESFCFKWNGPQFNDKFCNTQDPKMVFASKRWILGA